MLVLTRKKDEGITVTFADGTRARIVVAQIRGDKVRLGLEGPETVTFHRDEIQAEVDRKNGDTPQC